MRIQMRKFMDDIDTISRRLCLSLLRSLSALSLSRETSSNLCSNSALCIEQASSAAFILSDRTLTCHRKTSQCNLSIHTFTGFTKKSPQSDVLAATCLRQSCKKCEVNLKAIPIEVITRRYITGKESLPWSSCHFVHPLGITVHQQMHNAWLSQLHHKKSTRPKF